MDRAFGEQQCASNGRQPRETRHQQISRPGRECRVDRRAVAKVLNRVRYQHCQEKRDDDSDGDSAGVSTQMQLRGTLEGTRVGGSSPTRNLEDDRHEKYKAEVQPQCLRVRAGGDIAEMVGIARTADDEIQKQRGSAECEMHELNHLDCSSVAPDHRSDRMGRPPEQNSKRQPLTRCLPHVIRSRKAARVQGNTCVSEHVRIKRPSTRRGALAVADPPENVFVIAVRVADVMQHLLFEAVS